MIIAIQENPNLISNRDLQIDEYCLWSTSTGVAHHTVTHAAFMFCIQRQVSFWFATGGAGFCLSQGLALKMKPWAR